MSILAAIVLSAAAAPASQVAVVATAQVRIVRMERVSFTATTALIKSEVDNLEEATNLASSQRKAPDGRLLLEFS